MGWTGYWASHYNRDGSVNRKAECDSEMSGVNSEGTTFEVLKSRMVGSTYYAAVKRTEKNGDARVLGVVCLTSTERADGCNFFYKDMSEGMGPTESKCPLSILNLLSPTEDEYALAWRERCRKNAEQPSLWKLPIGTLIEFEWGGKTIRAEKRAPAYQFKTPWWDVGGQYIKKNRIPQNFRVVA